MGCHLIGHILNAQNEWRSSTDAHRHNSKLWQLDAEMLNVVPGEELGGTTLLGVLDASEMPAAKQMLSASFTFHLFFFFCKSKHPLQISFGRQKQVRM